MGAGAVPGDELPGLLLVPLIPSPAGNVGVGAGAVPGDDVLSPFILVPLVPSPA